MSKPTNTCQHRSIITHPGNNARKGYAECAECGVVMVPRDVALLAALKRQEQYWALQASLRELNDTERGYLLDARAALRKAQE